MTRTSLDRDQVDLREFQRDQVGSIVSGTTSSLGDREL